LNIKIVTFDKKTIIKMLIAFLKDNRKKENTVVVSAELLEKSEFLASYVAKGTIVLKATNGRRLPTWGYLSQLIANTPTDERSDLFVEITSGQGEESGYQT